MNHLSTDEGLLLTTVRDSPKEFHESLVRWCVDMIGPELHCCTHLIEWREQSSVVELQLRFNSLTQITVVRGTLTVSLRERPVGGEMEWSYDPVECEWQVEDENVVRL